MFTPQVGVSGPELENLPLMEERSWPLEPKGRATEAVHREEQAGPGASQDGRGRSRCLLCTAPLP